MCLLIDGRLSNEYLQFPKKLKKLVCIHNDALVTTYRRTPVVAGDFDDYILEVFEDLLPCCEYGFHTIVSITVYPDVKGKKLL